MPSDTFRRASAALAALELPVLLAISPALLFPAPRRLAVLAVVPVLWASARLSGGRWLPRTPFNAALALLLLMVAVSLGATLDLRNSLGKVAGVVFGALLFWAVTRWTSSERRLRVAAVAFLAAGGLLALVGLLGTNWLEKFPGLAAIVSRLPRVIRGVPGAEEGFHPNAVAGCLVLFVPLQVALLAARRNASLREFPGRAGRGRRWGLAQAALLLFTSGTLVLTQSRGAWIGLAAAGLAFLFLRNRRSRLVAVALVVALAAVVSTRLGGGRGAVAEMAVRGSGAGLMESVDGRLELWGRALLVVRDHPLTGTGMNGFRRLLPAAYPAFLPGPEYDVAHAHNHLLQAALDLGLPGLVAYLSLWLIAGWLLLAVCRRASDEAHRLMAGGLAAGLLAHFVFGMTDAIPLGAKVGVLFWLALALCASLHQVALGRRATAAPAAPTA